MDSVEPNGHHKAVLPVRKKGLISGNYAITEWLIKEKELDKLLELTPSQKVFKKKTPFEYSIRIAYQTPVTIDFDGTKKEALSSTFEDCMVYSNYKLLKELEISNKEDATGSLIKKIHTALNTKKTFEELHMQIYTDLRNGKSDQKAEFALDLIYSIDPSKLTVPPYIAEGLEWLQTYLSSEGC